MELSTALLVERYIGKMKIITETKLKQINSGSSSENYRIYSINAKLEKKLSLKSIISDGFKIELFDYKEIDSNIIYGVSTKFESKLMEIKWKYLFSHDMSIDENIDNIFIVKLKREFN